MTSFDLRQDHSLNAIASIMVKTRRQAAAQSKGAAAASSASDSPSSSRLGKGRKKKEPSSRRSQRKGSSAATESSQDVDTAVDIASSSASSTKSEPSLQAQESESEDTRPFKNVATIPLYDFDLPLELDLPYGSKVSAFNPAPYESLRCKFEEWFPELSQQDESHCSAALGATTTGRDQNDQRPGSAPTRPHGMTRPGRAEAGQQASTASKSKRRTGKAKMPDSIHLEVEIVPQVVSGQALGLPRNARGSLWPYLSTPLQAFAVYALAPPDYKPAHVKIKHEASSMQAASDLDDTEDDTERMLLGYIVPSAMRDEAHPLARLDSSLVTREWIQLYGEVTLAPPFLPPASEVVGQNSWERVSTKRPVNATNAKPATSSITVKTEPGLETSTPLALKTEPGTDVLPPTQYPYGEIYEGPVPSYTPSTRLLGVLSVQVGLEPVALQYGADDADVDGFVASNDDLKNTAVEGSLTLAKLLRQALPSIVDWKHSFVEIDLDAHTYWDRNESFYSLPPKQSTLARHLMLDKIESVDSPAAPKASSKKRKKSSRSSGYGSHHAIFSPDRDGHAPGCGCFDRRPEPSRPKLSAMPLGEKVKATDPRLGDATKEDHLPLDTNIASLLEACRPRSDGPQVYPPADMIPTPLMGYQARCLAWMIKRETVVDEDVGHLMPNWVPLRCKTPAQILQRRLELEAERAVIVSAMQRGISRPRRTANVKAASAEVAKTHIAASTEGAGTTDAAGQANGQLSRVLKREPFIDPVDVTFYYDQVSGMLSLRRFTCRRSEPGGALCESMGLGKTLESLSLIAAHPRPDEKELLSYDTSRSAKMITELDAHERPFVSRATLVVCPAALVEQWMDEIRKHFRSRSTPEVPMHDDSASGDETIEDDDQQPGVVRYRHADFAWDVSSSRDEVRALAKDRLTQPDIVVATYEELAFQLSESHRVHRCGNQVRTPLLEVLFWRILLDEAQIVAVASSKATQMVHELWRSNCWMVTGTPVTKGIRDIQGIFAFMDHDPFAAPRFFRDVLEEPFTQGTVEGIRRLRSILPRFVWRHTQAHVEEEMTLPPCKSEVLELELKHVEKLFYDKEVSKYREIFAKKAGQGVNTVSQPAFLVDLRQLLSHPQIADQLMFSHNYSRLSFAELFRQFCRQAQSELDTIRMQVVTNTLQLVWVMSSTKRRKTSENGEAVE